MKKKIVLFGFILIGVLSLILTYKMKQNSLNKTNQVKEEKLSIMIKEQGSTEYTKSSSKDIPKGSYTLNTEKSYCKNNGKIESYDNSTGTVSFAFIGTDKCFLYFDYGVTYAYETILMDNGAENGKASSAAEAISYISSKGEPDISVASTTNEGLYKAEDDQGSSYYFRGAVDNNWVTFGDTGAGTSIYWRIVRINGDNSIRLIYSFGSEGSGCSSLFDNDNFNVIGCNVADRFLTTYSAISNAYGLKYDDENSQHGNTINNTILESLYSFYQYYNLDTYREYIADTLYCNDRSASDLENGDYGEVTDWDPENISYFFGGYKRATLGTPKLTCTTREDVFSTNRDFANLDYPIGLLTVDEAIMAGISLYNQTEGLNYLHTINDSFWTMTPVANDIHNLGYGTSIYCIDSDYEGTNSSEIIECDIQQESGLRPVISLKANTIFSGSGTYDDPYTVVG